LIPFENYIDAIIIFDIDRVMIYLRERNRLTINKQGLALLDNTVDNLEAHAKFCESLNQRVNPLLSIG